MLVEYSSEAKRTNPSVYIYILNGANPVTKIYTLKSYFLLFIKCGGFIYLVSKN